MSYCGFSYGPSSSTLIESQLSTVMDYGNNAYNQAMAAIQSISNLYGSVYTAREAGLSTGGSGDIIVSRYPIDLPSFTKPIPTPTIEAEEFTTPTLPPSAVDAADSIPEEYLGSSSPLGMMDNQFDVLLAKYNDSLDRCSIATELCATLVEFLDGNLGLSAEVVQAMRDRAYSSEDLSSYSAERQIMEEWLARGFTQPSGVLDAKLFVVKQQNRDKRSELNRTILIEEEKFAMQTRQFGVDQAVKYENFLRDQYIKLFETAKDMVAAAFGFNLETAKLSLQEWVAQLDHFKTLLQGEVSRIQASAELSNARVKLYEAEIGAEKASTDLEATEQGLILQKAKIDGDITMKAYELEQQKLIEETRTTLSALDGIARTGSQLAAGALSALNMSASIGNSTSFSNDTSCSTNYNVEV